MNTTNNKKLNKLINRYSDIQEKLSNMGGYEIQEKLGKVINSFKLNNLLNNNFNTLSGGKKTIVNFAKLVLNNPDILLLDEPTNYLDIEMLELLEKVLKIYKGTIVIVSHDRYFLDKIVTKTILIENGKPIVFHGNYSYYIGENEKRIMLENKSYNEQQT